MPSTKGLLHVYVRIHIRTPLRSRAKAPRWKLTPALRNKGTSGPRSFPSHPLHSIQKQRAVLQSSQIGSRTGPERPARACVATNPSLTCRAPAGACLRLGGPATTLLPRVGRTLPYLSRRPGCRLASFGARTGGGVKCEAGPEGGAEIPGSRLC